MNLPPKMYDENRCYTDGTYTMPWIEGFTPYGPWTGNVILPCSGCDEQKQPTFWITHNVNRTRQNADKDGNYGNYTQVSRYCEQCKPNFYDLALELHKQPNKQCIMM